MKTGLTKKQKVTEVYYNAKDPVAEVYTHDANLKKCMRRFAEKYPELCQFTEDNGQGGLRFDMDKSRISIRLTALYTEDRRKTANERAKQRGVHKKRIIAVAKDNASQLETHLPFNHLPVALREEYQEHLRF